MILQALPKFSEAAKDGKLITFCGVDGTGKSTAINQLQNYLESIGKQVVLTKQPTPEVRELPIFKDYIYHPELRDSLDYKALTLFMIADRINHVKREILPALAQGNYVLCDRYIFTMLAAIEARGYDYSEWIWPLVQDIPEPHAAFVMYADIETVVQRISSRKTFEDSYVERKHIENMMNSYRKLAVFYDVSIVNTSEHNINEVLEIMRSALLRRQVIAR